MNQNYSEMKTPEQIIQWLKDQRIYDKFIANYYDKFIANYNRGVQHKMSVGVYLKRTVPANLFTCAFVWHNTREGNRYWFNINNNFLKWLNNEKDNVQ